MGNEGQGSRGDHLTATTPDGKIELTEEELSRVAGGNYSAKPKIHLTTVKDKTDTYLA